MSSPSQYLSEALAPYRKGLPSHPQLTANDVVSVRNWEVAQDVLPPELLALVRNGELTITVAPTQDYPLHERYCDATLRYAAEVSLDTQGNLEHYRSGLPFPVIDQVDPQAGLKIAWNLRYRSLGGDSEELRILLTTFQGDAVESTLEMGVTAIRRTHSGGKPDGLPQWW